MGRCSQGVEIEKCKLGIPRDGKIRCTQKRDKYLWRKFRFEMFPAGKPDDPYGECDNSNLYVMGLNRRKRLIAWRKRAQIYLPD